MDGAHGKSTVQRVIETQDPDIGTTTVDAIQLKKSILTGSPPTYETVETIPI
jgi:2'-5' RNA ligase